MGLVSEEDPGPRPVGRGAPGGVLRHEGLPLPLVSPDQTFLGALEHESQSVQIVQATAAAQADAPTFQDKLPYHFPVPVGQADARLGGQLLHPCPQLALLRLAESGGEPRDCSNIKAARPPSPKAAAHLPMVCRSRSGNGSIIKEPLNKNGGGFSGSYRGSFAEIPRLSGPVSRMFRPPSWLRRGCCGL